MNNIKNNETMTTLQNTNKMEKQTTIIEEFTHFRTGEECVVLRFWNKYRKHWDTIALLKTAPQVQKLLSK